MTSSVLDPLRPTSYYCVIRGPLGVGKSSVARSLAKAIAAEYVAIDRILEEERLEEWEEDRISQRSFLRANDFAVARARPSLAQATPVVFDGNFYWRSVLDDLIRRLPFLHFVFTLEAPLDVCIERDRQRPTPGPGAEPRAGNRLGAEAAARVYALVMLVRYGESIDATGTVADTVAKIRSRLPSPPT
jgi:predicted kinase